MGKSKKTWEELHREEYIENCAREMSLAHPPQESKEEEKENVDNDKNTDKNDSKG